MLSEVWYNYADGVRTKAYSYEYTVQGQLYKLTDHLSGEETHFEYDSLGRITFSEVRGLNETDSEYSVDSAYSTSGLIKRTNIKLGYIAGNETKIYNHTIEYAYGNGGVIVGINAGGVAIDKELDNYGRVEESVLTYGDFSQENFYSYKLAGNTTDGMLSSYRLNWENVKINGVSTTRFYSYDGSGNITKVEYSGGQQRYVYDELNQLIREDNTSLGKTYVYTYDNAGNILTKSIYALTAEGVTPTNPISVINYGYGNESWGDQLTSYNSQAITYDNIGNPLSYYNGQSYAFEWVGRQLTGVTMGSNTISLAYNNDGLRISKASGNTTVEYIYLDGILLAEKTSTYMIVYIFDENGSPTGFKYRLNTDAADTWQVFVYEKNIFGDIVAVYTADGVKQISYVYDAWGNFTTTYHNGASATSVAAMNPYKYRGYYYDNEIGLYYLQSRYYDSDIGRFISEDPIETGGLDMLILKWNSFAYCENEPVRRIDPNGCYWYQNYYGFKKTSVGFNLYANIAFLSRTFCLSYAYDFLRANGTWHWYGRTYSGMGQLRIAQELWFHAIVYYIGMPLQTVLKAVGISWKFLNDMVDKAKYMEIDSTDKRSLIFAAIWWAGLAIKLAICKKLKVSRRIIAAIVL